MNIMPGLAAGTSFFVLTAVVSAQTPADGYPNKPVRIITGAAGATVHDVATRLLGQRLSERWGQPIVVENQPAAALTIGTRIAARATPDGYTLLMSDRSALSVAPSLYTNLQYDPLKDFSPITLTARLPSALVAHPSVPATTLRESTGRRVFQRANALYHQHYPNGPDRISATFDLIFLTGWAGIRRG